MLKTVALLICALNLSVSARKCNIMSPTCLHMYFDDKPKLTMTFNYECDLDEMIANSNGKDFQKFQGRCFVKKCDFEESKSIINTGTPLCVNFLGKDSMNFDSETELNEFLCENEEYEVSSIPGSSKC